MFSNNELAVIWFALLMEQQNQDEGSDRWWKYERMIRRIEDALGATKRPLLKVVKTDE
jgi:hypothetical protein